MCILTRLVKLPRVFSWILGICTCAVILILLSFRPKEIPAVDEWYLGRLTALQNDLFQLRKDCTAARPLPLLKLAFLKCRQSYKQLAILTEYFNPLESKILNGPALPRVEDDNPFTIIPPHGFQRMEDLLYGSWKKENTKMLTEEIDLMQFVLTQLEKETDRSLKFKPEYVWEALRFSVIRLITMGITGYDSPVARLSIPEARATLTGLDTLTGLIAHEPERLMSYEKIRRLISKADAFLSVTSSFDTFDRLSFIRNCADPLYGELASFAQEAHIASPAGKHLIDPMARSLFSKDAFQVQFFTPDEQYKITSERIALGRMLFYDPVLSATKKRSCASCHRPEKAFTDGLTVPLDMDRQTQLTRNTPTLINSVFQAKQFYDSRTNLLENQLDEVVHNTREMNGSLKRSVGELKAIPTYKKLFEEAYPGEPDPLSGYNIANAISSYVRSLVAMNARFDRYMRGEPGTMNQDERKGFNLFAGKAKCATCHFIPFFNGSVPPEYTESESEVLGIPERANGKKKLDPDRGKEGFTQASVHAFAFKTPTLRNSSLTAPYMHNGVFNTLEQVMDFYNKAGGYGLGIAPASMTLPNEPLRLTALEKKQVIAFLKCLTDTVVSRPFLH